MRGLRRLIGQARLPVPLLLELAGGALVVVSIAAFAPVPVWVMGITAGILTGIALIGAGIALEGGK